MKLRSIDFDDDNNPKSATFTLSIEQITLIASLFGKFSGRNMRDSYGDEYIPAQSGLYNGTTFVINSFYEAGIDDLLRYNDKIDIAVSSPWKEAPKDGLFEESEE